MKFTSSNQEDIKKYFLGTFFKIKEHADTLFFMDRVNRTTIEGRVEDNREFIIYLDDAHPFEMDYVLPHKSFFQYERDAYQLYRVPARQYFRGLNGGNTNVARLNDKGEREGLEEELSFKVLKAFVSKQPFNSLATASTPKNIEGKRSVVLTPRMAFHRLTKGIYIDFTRVATLDVQKKEITMWQPVFKQEVQSFLKSTNESHEYKVL